jgi:NodT family efflux transporter outer membrane factor (OMF) lipoprotein
MKLVRILCALALPAALGGCALTPPAKKVDAPVPPQWQAPLPHQGSVTDLNQWWRSQGDPLLAELIEAAQAASPTLAAAQARVAGARAEQVAARAALLPALDASLSANRASQQSTLPMGTMTQAGVQAGWELDLFGGRRAARSAAEERLAGAAAQWHEARVSVAAEVANQYFALRTCERLLEVARQDAASRADTSRLTELTAKAGFQAPATAALARASAAEGASRLTQQQALCEIDIKTLVALTALDEAALRARLSSARQAPLAPIGVAVVPAELLAQRPDVYNAERALAAASFDVASAQAQRYPRVTLQGSVGAANFRTGGEDISGSTWTIGPVAITVPVFDAGRRRANVDAARAQYDAAVSAYRGVMRQAVAEVEQALVNLNSVEARTRDAQTALEGYRTSFTAVEDRYKNGLASLLELEDARRTRLLAENAVVVLERERNAAWVALYRAAGGGFRADASLAAAPAPSSAQ